MAITAGQDILASDFIYASERNATKSNDVGRVPKLEADGYLDPEFFEEVADRQVFEVTDLGDNTTQYDITNPSGTTFRYTYDGTGTDPGISASTVPTGSYVRIRITSTGVDSVNAGIFQVTGSGTNYFEVTNASGSVESNKLFTLQVTDTQTWTKPTGAKFVEVEVIAGGGSGTGGSTGAGGGAGAYAYKLYNANVLGSTEDVFVGLGGVGKNTNGVDGQDSTFDAITATGGDGATGSTGGSSVSASGGDININGEAGTNSTSIGVTAYSGFGGNSIKYGQGGRLKIYGTGAGGGIQGEDATGYGAGGGGCVRGASGTYRGGDAGNGLIIITTYFL